MAGFIVQALTTKLFSQFLQWFGFHGLFWMYASASMACLVFGYIFLPETSGLSLVKIEETYGKKKGNNEEEP